MESGLPRQFSSNSAGMHSSGGYPTRQHIRHSALHNSQSYQGITSGLPRQFSSNSAGMHSSGGYPTRQHIRHSALLNSQSYQGITLIRGASCSLVDIPTCMGPISQLQTPESLPLTGELQPLARQRQRPRLQLDLTQRKPAKSSTRKTKWTVLCVGLTLLMMSITVIGTMLSVGSQYQQVISWI